MSDLGSAYVDPDGRWWHWDPSLDCYRHDGEDGSTLLSREWFDDNDSPTVTVNFADGVVEFDSAIDPAFREVLPRVAAGELTADEAIQIVRERRGGAS